MSKKSQPKSKTIQGKKNIGSSLVAKLVLAGYLLGFMFLQLFTFEKFPPLLNSVGVAGVWSTVVAIVLVVVELLALAFLLSINGLPRTVQKISAACMFVALAGLTTLEVLGFSKGQLVMLGATLELPGGSWSLLMLAALWVLAIWAVFGGRLGQPRHKAL